MCDSIFQTEIINMC